MEILYRKKYPNRDTRRWEERTYGSVLAEYYLDLAIELDDLQNLSKDGSIDENQIERMQTLEKALSDNIDKSGDPWLDDWEGEIDEKEEILERDWKPDEFM